MGGTGIGGAKTIGKEMKIIADPRGNYRYFTWYILGFERLYGKGCISYDVEPFVGLKYGNWSQCNCGMPVIVVDGKRTAKIFIDTSDSPLMQRDRYEWCDVYGKVNPYKGIAEEHSKVMYLGPGFGLRMQGAASLFLLAVHNYRASRHKTAEGLRTFISKYMYSYIRRRPIDDYLLAEDVKENYVFHASTIWHSKFAKTDINVWRAEFLRACKKAGLTTEGGMYFIKDHSDLLREMPDYPLYKETFKDIIYYKRISMDEYIRKTKQSVLVFNTPTVLGCHGWKLAEYLCMGKAIISTPLLRDLPSPLVHGENIHFVKTPEELYDAIVKINTDVAYRKHLEQGAREYYEKWIAPEVVTGRLLNANGIL